MWDEYLNDYIQFGLENKPFVIEEFQRKHPNLKVTPSFDDNRVRKLMGFDNLTIGYRFDGLLDDDGILEIRTVPSIGNFPVNRTNVDFIIDTKDGQFTLDRSTSRGSRYYDQVQLYMYFEQKKYTYIAMASLGCYNESLPIEYDEIRVQELIDIILYLHGTNTEKDHLTITEDILPHIYGPDINGRNHDFTLNYRINK